MSDEPLRVGDVLFGFCGGFFGRDSYQDKRIEAIGADWVVARDDMGHVHVATFDQRDGWTLNELKQYREPEQI